LVDDNCLRFNVFSCYTFIANYEFIVYLAFIHIYFRRHKFSIKMDMVRKTGAENRRHKMEPICGACFCECVMSIKETHDSLLRLWRYINHLLTYLLKWPEREPEPIMAIRPNGV